MDLRFVIYQCDWIAEYVSSSNASIKKNVHATITVKSDVTGGATLKGIKCFVLEDE